MPEATDAGKDSGPDGSETLSIEEFLIPVFKHLRLPPTRQKEIVKAFHDQDLYCSSAVLESSKHDLAALNLKPAVSTALDRHCEKWRRARTLTALDHQGASPPSITAASTPLPAPTSTSSSNTAAKSTPQAPVLQARNPAQNVKYVMGYAHANPQRAQQLNFGSLPLAGGQQLQRAAQIGQAAFKILLKSSAERVLAPATAVYPGCTISWENDHWHALVTLTDGKTHSETQFPSTLDPGVPLLLAQSMIEALQDIMSTINELKQLNRGVVTGQNSIVEMNLDLDYAQDVAEQVWGQRVPSRLRANYHSSLVRKLTPII